MLGTEIGSIPKDALSAWFSLLLSLRLGSDIWKGSKVSLLSSMRKTVNATLVMFILYWLQPYIQFHMSELLDRRLLPDDCLAQSGKSFFLAVDLDVRGLDGHQDVTQRA